MSTRPREEPSGAARAEPAPGAPERPEAAGLRARQLPDFAAQQVALEKLSEPGPHPELAPSRGKALLVNPEAWLLQGSSGAGSAAAILALHERGSILRPSRARRDRSA